MKIPRFRRKEEKRSRVLEWVLVLRPPPPWIWIRPCLGGLACVDAHPKGPLDDGWHYTHVPPVDRWMRGLGWWCQGWAVSCGPPRVLEVSGVGCPTLVAGETFRSTDDKTARKY